MAGKPPGVVAPLSDALSSVAISNKTDEPVIPFSVLDAPSQRAYALAAYAALFAWRLYDYSTLMNDDADSLFFFMKWATIDGLYMYGLPALRIPWLQWSSTTTIVLFMLHAFLDGLLMFRVAVCVDLVPQLLSASLNNYRFRSRHGYLA